MHTIVETASFKISVKKAGMTEDEVEAARDAVMADPEGGDIIQGAGGIRKVRLARRGEGKSGGYRILTYYMQKDRPAFLLFVIDKTKDDNLTDEQTRILKATAKRIRDEWRD